MRINKKGISLMSLVITIVVMITIAGAIIISLNNTGVIKKANEAVDLSDATAVKELAQTAWGEAYLNFTDEEKNDDYYQQEVEAYLNKQGITSDKRNKYIISATTEGVKVKLAAEAWVKDGFTVVRGDEVLQLGDTINYTATGTGYSGGWKVLGADKEGNLLIVSADNVTTVLLGDSDIDKAQLSWLNGVYQLDKACLPYGGGLGTVGKARSITAEDVNTVTGYNPDKNKYASAQIYGYNNQVKYEWDGASKIKFTGVQSGSTTYTYNYFTWYDEKTGTFPKVNKGVTTPALPTLTSTSYIYYAKDYIDPTKNSKVYTMLFGEDNVHYWLASYSSNTGPGIASLGFRMVTSAEFAAEINYYNIWFTYGFGSYSEKGVRAVVTLQSDLVLTGSSTTGWSYTVN